MKARAILVLLMAALYSGPTQAAPPAGKQWKMVWSDEFEGASLDTSKWFQMSQPGWPWPGIQTRESDVKLVDGQGSLVLRLTRDPDGTVRYHRGVHSLFKRAYGYFEARVQFSRQPGWWTGVWLTGVPYDDGPDAFVNAQEFDIFEDFYKPKKQNDIGHCYHCSAVCGPGTDTTRGNFGDMIGAREITRVSYGHKTILKTPYEGWHTVGFEWSPLEHIWYVDGQETFRQNYREVPVTTVPQHVWITGELRVPRGDEKPFYGRLEEATFPDSLVVDYVHAYEEDTGKRRAPVVTLAPRGQGPFKQGEPVAFDVRAVDQDGKVVSLMLFSMGRLRAETAAEGAEVTTSLTVSNLFFGPNTVIAMAKDSDGLVGMSAPLRIEVVTGKEYSGTPYGDKPQTIPGRIVAGYYDKGGNGVAYFTTATDPKHPDLKFRADEIGLTDRPDAIPVGGGAHCRWVTYAVMVEEPGEYEVELWMNRPDYYVKLVAPAPAMPERTEIVQLDIGRQKAAEWEISSRWDSGGTWRVPTKTVGRRRVRLEAGQQRLIVRFDRLESAGFHFGGLTFVKPSK